MTDSEKMADVIARQVKLFVARELAPYADRLGALEIKKGVVYRGTWSPSAEYSSDQCATFRGALWLCRVASTQAKPGTDSDWRLVSKKDIA